MQSATCLKGTVTWGITIQDVRQDIKKKKTVTGFTEECNPNIFSGFSSFTHIQIKQAIRLSWTECWKHLLIIEG